MKTLLKTTALLVTLTILLSVNLNASIFNFSEEKYIDDIPFNTTEIYNNLIGEQTISEFDFEDERYINDIPFDTECISIDCLYQEAISIEFQIEEEEYIDDIEASVFYVSAHLFPYIVDLLVSQFTNINSSSFK